MKQKAKAYCLNPACSKILRTAIDRIPKNVPFSATNCPDCGHALVWTKLKVVREYTGLSEKEYMGFKDENEALEEHTINIGRRFL